jgi:outer membrane protein OmpA-like peptidoglycan-associated protein
VSNNFVIRADLSLFNNASTNNYFENTDGSGKSGTYKTSMNSWGIGVGTEYHFLGNSRFSPFVGAQLGFSPLGVSEVGDNSDGFSFSDNYKTESEIKGSSFGFGLLIGADYWVSRSFYIGTEFGFGYTSTSFKDGSEVTNGVKSVTPGSTVSALGDFIAPSIRLGWNINGKGDFVDSDGDGVPDHLDKCNNTPKGVKVDANGCPEIVNEVRALAKLVLFETNSDKIKTESFVTLDKVASIMKLYPDAYLTVEGHTDNTGDLNMNVDLSKRRAQSVLNYLANKGVDVSHIKAEGYGPNRPIADNNTAEGSALNRRVALLLSF